MSRLTVALYFTVASLLNIFFCGYSFFFPESDIVEQLLHVLRLQDPSYLSKDWYVNAVMGSPGAYRLGGDIAMSWLMQFFAIEWIYFIYYCFGLMVLPWLGYLIARKGFGAHSKAGFIAGLLLIGVHNGSVSSTQLFPTAVGEPSIVSFAAPVSLSIVLLFIIGRPFLGALASTVLSFLHPLIGFMTGLYSLFALVTARATDLCGGSSKNKLSHLAALVTLFGVGYFWMLQAPRPETTYEDFFAIFRARLPHHYWPSKFPMSDWLSFFGTQAIFLFGVYFYPKNLNRNALKFAINFSSILLATCLLSYFFIEVFPWRPGLIVQAFRYLYLQNSLALILLALIFAERLERFQNFKYLWLAIALAVALWVSVNQPLSHAGILLVVLLIIGIENYGTTFTKYLLRTSTSMLLIIGFASQSEWNGLLPITALDEKLDFNISADRARAFRQEEKNRNGIDGAEIYRLADFSRSNISKDAIFIVPPNFAAFRVIAERAIVVDGKSVLLGNPEPWAQRMADAYGFDFREDRDSFWDYLWSLQKSYRDIPQSTITKIKEKYGATHAILFQSTASPHLVVFKSKEFKIVDLSN